ncbi:NAD(P)/FAD-dependent oxidoreductase [Pseudotabrizicola alkalilacus]|uniref:FAD-binding oxidoreductase n=1 Tax=Pseudotabrizicola alkalilacus TaxID=2305252 RepID=A0A411Z315_9RHOB|nr:FAD-binding oxidoreductase [Pseudotabrizicola alkalilacus]RGP37454.1 FAD-binding oxidoreductase [Pseudotabrizicola alkalilacus]
MAPVISAVQTTADIPAKTTVVVIGAGIVGLSAALTLAERGIPVVVVEKGRIAAEQSSRNLGWVRKTSRAAADVPLALAADRLWAEMPARTGEDGGYRQTGILFAARSGTQMALYEKWLASVAHLDLGSCLLTPSQINELVPGGRGTWAGGIYTPSDARAEPTLANSAIARAAIAKGALIVENCAVRTISTAGGKVSAVITERGEIACDQVLLAGGLGSRRFLGNMGISLPTLPLVCSVLRTMPMDGPTEIAIGAPDFSFRKRLDGGFTITQRGRLDAPLTPDHLRIGLAYLPQLRAQRGALKIGLGKAFLRELATARHWAPDAASPFEKERITDPLPNHDLNAEALRNLRAAWPVFETAQIAQSWAGTIDVTPDSDPVISAVAQIPGLTLATGFSGHGFGTGPAAGHLAADLVSAYTPIVDPAPYRFDRFKA